MKKSYLCKMTILSVLLVSFLVIAGCSSGGGGAAPGVVTSALTKTVAFLAGGDKGGQPFADTSALHMMILYRAQEMKGSGAITAISFKYDDGSAPAVSCPHVTINMGHTYLAGLNDAFASNINTGQGSQQPVLNDATVNIPVGTAGGYYTIPLTTPFNYNGVDNLVVEITRNACTGNVNTTTHDIGTYKATDVGGTATTWLPDTKFTLSGGDNTISSTLGGTQNYPFALSHKIQLLYTAAEINGSGPITSIGFPVGGPTVASSSTVTVKLGHTSLTDLTATFADNFNSGTPVTVTNARTFTIPAGTPDGAYVWIPLPDGAFNYNGTDNLVVEIEASAITGGVGWYFNSVGSHKTRVEGDFGATTGTTTDTSHYYIKFRFAGGPVDVITGGTNFDGQPFLNSSNIRQELYLASELGAKGTITKVAHRLNNDPGDGSYVNFTVKLANTAATTLNNPFSGNYTSASTVYSGTYSISSSSGLKAGDWIEIPLSTPFVIDPTKNLIVQMSAHTGSATNYNRGLLDATRCPNRKAYNTTDDTSDAASITNFLADLRLIIQ